MREAIRRAWPCVPTLARRLRCGPSVGMRRGHIFDRAADRVAAVERALRPAQNFDPLDVVDVEHRGLRTVEIDVVEIEADALLEPGDRVLLADAADEGGQRACWCRARPRA